MSKFCVLSSVLWLMAVFIHLSTNTYMRALKVQLYAMCPSLDDRAGMFASIKLKSHLSIRLSVFFGGVDLSYGCIDQHWICLT